MASIKPEISIITPLYNSQEYISQTIASVLSQSFTNFEWIIVDDGSTDNSLEIVQSIEDERVKVFTQENAGTSAARNHGLSKAQGDVIVFIDSDDMWNQDRLKKHYEAFTKSKYGEKVLISSYYMFQGDEIVHYSPLYNFEGKIDSIMRFHPHLLNPGAIMLNRSIIEKIGNFNDFYYHEDYDFFIRLLENYPVISMPERLLYYRYYIESKCTRCLENYEYKNSYTYILKNYFEKTDKEYSEEYRQKAYDMCFHVEVFLLLSLKDNIPMAKKIYDKYIVNKRAFVFSPRGFFVLLTIVTGFNFVMPIRKVIQKANFLYFKHIKKHRVLD